jgi:ribosomal protein S12 methylthiotransferase
LLTPYLDIPFQHASPSVLRAMKRPANEAKVLDACAAGVKSARILPSAPLSSSASPARPRTISLPARLARRSAARPRRRVPLRTRGRAVANDLPGAVPEEVKEERYARLMEKTEAISRARLEAKVGRTLRVIIDEVGEPDEEGDIGATGRSQADARKSTVRSYLRDVPATLAPGDFVDVVVEDADAHDLYGVIAGS